MVLTSLPLPRGLRTVSPSIPAVRRPALVCVTRFTLWSVFECERSMSFCRFLTLFRFPCCAALKTLYRSRFTLRSVLTQSMLRQWEASSGSVPRGRLPGFLRLRFSIQFATSRYLTCAPVIAGSLIVFKGPPDPRGLPFGSDIESVSAGLCVAGEAPGSTFSPELSLQQHSLLGSSSSRKGSRPSSPPAYQPPLDPYGVVVFHSCQLRPKEDASYTPGPMVIAPF